MAFKDNCTASRIIDDKTHTSFHSAAGEWWLWEACWASVGLGNSLKWQRAGGSAVKLDRWPLWSTHTAPEDTILPSILFTHSLSSFVLLTTPASLQPTGYLKGQSPPFFWLVFQTRDWLSSVKYTGRYWAECSCCPCEKKYTLTKYLLKRVLITEIYLKGILKWFWTPNCTWIEIKWTRIILKLYKNVNNLLNLNVYY